MILIDSIAIGLSVFDHRTHSIFAYGGQYRR